MTQSTSWQRVRELVAQPGAGVLDIRSRIDFAARHLPRSLNIPVDGTQPLEELLPAYLMPPRHAHLLIVADDHDAAELVTAWFRDRGRSSVMSLQPDWSTAAPSDVIQGTDSACLWQPPAWLAEHAHELSQPDAGPVVDFGCGSGRAAVWLLQRGYNVTAIDRYDEALGWAQQLAGDHAPNLTTRQADLTDAAQWTSGPWAAALAFRFLHRPLVEALPGLVQQGGIAMIRTFRWVEGEWTLPRRKFCLEPGELLSLFSERDWDVLVHREDTDPDGRPGAGIVARRR
jgi:SAM-dependent methyltransferase